MNQYEYGSTAPAYESYPKYHDHARFSVINSKRPVFQETQVSSFTVTIIKCVAFMILVVALACLVRVAFIATTFTVNNANASLRLDLSAARLTGNELEITHSRYGSADRITRCAIANGMIPSDEPEYLILNDSNVSVSAGGVAGVLESVSADIAVE
ncbi:MAG: hypothetical protein IKE43_12640 [Coriobacteriales bacterium]|nr:hypothetical protein [Coriobacteriales bacterium]